MIISLERLKLAAPQAQGELYQIYLPDKTDMSVYRCLHCYFWKFNNTAFYKLITGCDRWV